MKLYDLNMGQMEIYRVSTVTIKIVSILECVIFSQLSLVFQAGTVKNVSLLKLMTEFKKKLKLLEYIFVTFFLKNFGFHKT